MHLALHQFKNPVFLFKVTDTLKSYKKNNNFTSSIPTPKQKS